jgi:hypothetical protein
MDWNDVPTTIRNQFEEDKRIHETYCDEGYIIHINKFTMHQTEEKCAYCLKFRPEVYNGEF